MAKSPTDELAEAKTDTRRSCERKIVELTTERADLRGDDSPTARSRLTEINGEIRRLSKRMFDLEEDVEIQIPRSVTGEPFRINDRAFSPGRYVVKSSVAQQLTYMIDQNREAELNRMRAKNREVFLGNIGEIAQHIQTIQRD